MKKMFRPFSAIMMSAAIAASAFTMTAIPAFADDHTLQLNPDKATNDQAEHQYIAYQVFTGELGVVDGEKQLKDLQWANGVNSAALLAALKSASVFGSGDANLFKDCNDADEVALVLEQFDNNSDLANAFADIVAANINTANGYNIPTEKVPGPGYYFIKDTIKTLPSGSTQYAYSDHILKVLKDEDITDIKVKADVPSIEKKIGTEFDEGKKANVASIGDKVPFVLESSVPDMSKYNDYYYIITDTMSEGLTFNNDVEITVGTYTLTDSQFRVEQSGQTFKIVFLDFYEQLYQMGTSDTSDDGGHKGETITVKYSATLNEKAKLTSEGNPNTVNLTFSNNPNHDYKGEDEPTNDETDVVGKTPDSITKTFTTGIKLTKKDVTTKAPLEGAKFQITGEGMKAVLINGEIYKESTDGTYYMLKDGTFTDTDPASVDSETKKKYASTTVKYAKITAVTSSNPSATDTVNKVAYSKADGTISFTGLGEGTYQITELEAPEGYNKLDDKITIIIKATLDQENQTCTWTVKKDGEGINSSDNLFTFDVENSKGITLPGTGGIGTTVFYIVGAVLISGALVLLITKKRMNVKEK